MAGPEHSAPECQVPCGEDGPCEESRRRRCGVHSCWSAPVLLCAFGFFVNFLAGDPFIAKLWREHHDDPAKLNTYVWPMYVYSSLLFTLPIGLLAERVGYFNILGLGLALRVAARGCFVYTATDILVLALGARRGRAVSCPLPPRVTRGGRPETFTERGG